MGKIKSIRKNKESNGKSDINKINDATNRIMKFTFQTPADKAKYHTFATVKNHIATRSNATTKMASTLQRQFKMES